MKQTAAAAGVVFILIALGQCVGTPPAPADHSTHSVRCTQPLPGVHVCHDVGIPSALECGQGCESAVIYYTGRSA